MNKTLQTKNDRTKPTVVLPKELINKVIEGITSRHPVKSFGYFISDEKGGVAKDFIIFEGNNRNAKGWKEGFERRGQYFVDHADAGFVATPEEIWKFKKETCSRGMFEVGVFHSHQRHPANFSRVDHDLHIKSIGKQLWHALFSMRVPENPQVRVFEIYDTGVNEVSLLDSEKLKTEKKIVKQRGKVASQMLSKDEIIAAANESLRADKNELPLNPDAKSIVVAIENLLATEDESLISETLNTGIFRNSHHRYDKFVSQDMRSIKGARFLMGTDSEKTNRYCGETPEHQVEVLDYQISQYTVTNALYSKFSLQSDILENDQNKPKVNVTWYEAKLFAMWMGCRLVSEAEWEYACSQGGKQSWCCDKQSELIDYAWYSENSGSLLYSVGLKKPNSSGIYDLHGNVWEWCEDNYDDSFYSSSPTFSPVNKKTGFKNEALSQEINKVTRGGCMYSHAEMCRSRYRFHETPIFCAPDLGFRLCR